MQQLKDLENEVSVLAQDVGAPSMAFVGPKQFYGLELSVFAVELASMVVWIGYLQWSLANGTGNVQSPILERLDNIKLHDALMNGDGSEYEWPEADFIIGNPPFLGGKRMRNELGDEYVDQLFKTFDGRVPHEADFVCYWFEKARAMIAAGKTGRAGLLATNSIRGGANREVLRRILEAGGIFMAWSDEPWILEGAAVRVSLVGFDNGDGHEHWLDGHLVPGINSSLDANTDVSGAQRLSENAGKSFMGTTKAGPFEISGNVAHQWLASPNPSANSNRDVLRPWANGFDLSRRPRGMWIIDFGLMDEGKAASYVVPFEHVKEHIKPTRMQNKRDAYRERWWLHAEPRPAMREALRPLPRYLATVRHSKHRIFVWLGAEVLPDSALIAIATAADTDFGILQSHIHALWALRQGSFIGVGNDARYTPTTCFETFPFPHSEGDELDQVAAWARHLNEVRAGLLKGDSKLTMTKLYNELDDLREHRDSSHRAYPLLVAHEKLDQAVAAAYGWEWPLEDEEILRRLLELNLERAAEEADSA